jgi:hypothetical protein
MSDSLADIRKEALVDRLIQKDAIFVADQLATADRVLLEE